MEQPPHRSSGLNRFRQHSRVRISAPFVCALSRCTAHRWLRSPRIDLGVVYDLSICGARVSTEAEIRPGDEITLSLRLPKQSKPGRYCRRYRAVDKGPILRPSLHRIVPRGTESSKEIRGNRFNDCRVASRSFVVIIVTTVSCF